MNVLQYIKQNYDSFTDREKLIADYLIETKERIISMSARDIAEATKTSAPTVVRFAKKIGVNTLNELKLKLSINISKEEDAGAIQFQYLDNDLGTKNIIY
jgi:DNA-binding MurR/RpiR family transcriptional regulator